MSGVIANLPRYQFSSSTGAPLANGTLTVYVAGSTTPTNTWQDSALSTLNTNPVQLDSRGECVLWLDSAVSYKFILKNAAGVIQWTQDNISGAAPAGSLYASTGASLIGYMPAGTGAVATTVQGKLRESVSVLDFGAVGDGVTDDTDAIQAAIDEARSVYVPAGDYIVTGLTIPSNTRFHGDGYASHIKLKNSANSRLIYPADEAAIYSNVIIENLRLNGNAANQTTPNHHVIALRAYRQTRISNCWIEDAKGDGIIFSENTNGDDPTDFTVTDTFITGSGRNGLSITSGQRFSLINVFSHNAVSGANPGDGFDLETNSGRTIKDGKLIGCHAYNNYGRGFNLQANDANAVERVTLTDCHAHDNAGVGGFMLQSARLCLLSNCYAYNNTVDGFRLTLLAAFNRFSNCDAVDNDGYGFVEVGASTNNNKFLHVLSSGNVSNTITLTGSSSVARHYADATGVDPHELYTQGTITPTIGGESTNPSSVTYTTQTGWYTRSGDRVNFNIKVTVTAITGGTGGMCIDLDSALPLSANTANNDAILTAAADSLTFGAAGYLVGLMNPNSRRILLRVIANGAALNNFALDPACTIWVTGGYRAAV